MGEAQWLGVVRVHPRTDASAFGKPPPAAGGTGRVSPGQQPPFVAPPLRAVVESRHEQFVEEQLSVGRPSMVSRRGESLGQLQANQGVVGRSLVVFSGSEGHKGDQIMRVDPVVKRHVAAPPFHRAKDAPCPSCTQGNLCHVGGHPSCNAGIAVGLGMNGANEQVAVLHDACIHPQPSPDGRRHVPIQEQGTRARTPMVGFLAHPQFHRRRQRSRQAPLHAIHERVAGIEQLRPPQAIHGPIVAHFVRQGGTQWHPPT